MSNPTSISGQVQHQNIRGGKVPQPKWPMNTPPRKIPSFTDSSSTPNANTQLGPKSKGQSGRKLFKGEVNRMEQEKEKARLLKEIGEEEKRKEAARKKKEEEEQLRIMREKVGGQKVRGGTRNLIVSTRTTWTGSRQPLLSFLTNPFTISGSTHSSGRERRHFLDRLLHAFLFHRPILPQLWHGHSQEVLRHQRHQHRERRGKTLQKGIQTTATARKTQAETDVETQHDESADGGRPEATCRNS